MAKSPSVNNPEMSNKNLLRLILFLVLLGVMVYTIGTLMYQYSYENFSTGQAARQKTPPLPVQEKEAQIAPAQEASISEIVPMQDFPNDQQGIFIGQLNADYFKEPIDQIVVLFVSARIPGLSIMYFPYENRIVAGTPSMNVDNIVLFDGVSHEIKYAFQKDGNQQFWYDGNLVAESRFIPAKSSITGAVTGVSQAYVSDGFERIEVK